MVIRACLLIISLSINRVKAPIKRHRLGPCSPKLGLPMLLSLPNSGWASIWSAEPAMLANYAWASKIRLGRPQCLLSFGRTEGRLRPTVLRVAENLAAQAERELLAPRVYTSVTGKNDWTHHCCQVAGVLWMASLDHISTPVARTWAVTRGRDTGKHLGKIQTNSPLYKWWLE